MLDQNREGEGRAYCLFPASEQDAHRPLGDGFACEWGREHEESVAPETALGWGS